VKYSANFKMLVYRVSFTHIDFKTQKMIKIMQNRY